MNAAPPLSVCDPTAKEAPEILAIIKEERCVRSSA